MWNKKKKFVKGDQTGVVRGRPRGPTAVDKAAYVMTNFVTPALNRVLTGQAFKGVKYNIDHYRGGNLN